MRRTEALTLPPDGPRSRDAERRRDAGVVAAALILAAVSWAALLILLVAWLRG